MKTVIYILIIMLTLSCNSDKVFVHSKKSTPTIENLVAKLGNLVSAYTPQSINGAIWNDTYGINHGTAFNANEITTEIINGKKEIKFSGANSSFNLGFPSDINFIAKNQSFTFVLQIGSVVDFSQIRTILSQGGGGVTSRQFVWGISNTGKMFLTVGGVSKQASSVTILPNDIIAVVYDHTIGTDGQISWYKNGIFLSTDLLMGTNTLDNIVEPVIIGSRSVNQYEGWKGNMVRLYIFKNAINQENIKLLNDEILKL